MPFLKTKCDKCGKTAESEREFIIGSKTMLRLKCGHMILKEQLKETKSAANLESLDGKKPYPFQVSGIDFIGKSGGRALIADEMGLGKTIQALGAINTFDMWPCLIITKSTLTTQWQHETIRWCGPEFIPYHLEDSKTPLIPGFRVYVISFDLIRRFSEGKRKKKLNDDELDEVLAVDKKATGNRLIEQLKAANIKTIIIDECQAIKNPQSTRTAEVRALCAEVENVICLSGTPIKNNASEYFPVLNILKPEMYPNFNRFIYNDCEAYKSGFGWKVGGLRFPKEFLERTKSFIIRRERAQVMPDLPAITRNYQFCDLSKEVEQAYKATFQKFAAEFDEDDKSFESSGNTLAYLSKMRHLTGLSKIDPCVDFCMEFLGGTSRKLTIFVHHKDVGSLLEAKIKSLTEELGLHAPLMLTSDLSPEARAGIVESFMRDSDFIPEGPGHARKPQPRILIASTLASGEGLNLQKCSDCIMLERQWNPANEEQAEGRFIRIGQLAEAVTATYFVAVGTVDEFFAEIVEQKREYVSKSLSGESIKWDESSIIRELASVLMQKGGKKWGL
jgi:SNF2 family DNA or RNA helicase